MKMTAREVRERLRGKVDPELLKILEALAERQSVFHQQLMDAADTINNSVDMMGNLLHVMKSMQGEIDIIVPRLKKADPKSFAPEEDDGSIVT